MSAVPSAPCASRLSPLATLAAAVLAVMFAALLALTLAASPAFAGPTATSTEDPVDLRFSDFFRQPVGPRGLEIADGLRAIDGRTVRIVGYMVSREDAQAGRFQLTPRPVRMSEHADGDADDLPPATVTVLLDPMQQDRIVAHQPGLVALTGRLQVGRVEGADGRVSWFRLQLDPAATATTVSLAPAPAHSH
ncbi:hypothetical protein [Piscinibacter gummiphilus]|uniref:Uncharacterized protein n=1 Tax=Piscinibacter gummiphilus TaxID=946333 RepID=A0A1W6L7P9_9BURK|nr:hypothetical protein [Piscinibacter gummiphilus]ARN20200.1 hypothetical protein A4W93_09960 [Piscinibacter gummiphilus]GLS96504.1 hypothetical protein GCM10007918_37960 [Piscinibacter gummiphilus]